MTTIFEKIINKEIPGVFLYEDAICVVLMDKFPAVTGQALVIPREPVDYITNLDDDTYQHLWKVTKKIMEAMDKALSTKRTCLIVEGFEVPHAHIKLYPMTNTDKSLGATIVNQTEESDENLEEIAQKIKAELV